MNRISETLTQDATRTVAETSGPWPTRFERFSALAVLTVFALTWPVLGLLGNNAEFFLARRSPKGEILLLGVVMTLAIPALLATVGSLPGKAGAVIGFGMIALLSSLLAFLYLRRLPFPWWGAIGAALIVGSLATWAFHRFDPARQMARYLLPVPLVFLVAFLVATPAGAVLIDQGSVIGTAVPVESPVPVVMLVLDEFPVASVIDARGNLRTDLYPNLARLADDGTWFRNAVTVEQQTEHSVPAMLTGSIPDQSLTPFAGQYPNTLFTALQGAYELHVYETITRLCPVALCEGLSSSATPIAWDVGIVAGHVLLPDSLTGGLPEIDKSWGDFGAASEDFDMVAEFRKQLKLDARAPVQTLIEDIGNGVGDKPPLYFLHVLIPHHPWQFLPDGRRYPLVFEGNPAAKDGGWIDDEFLVAQSMQRHLLQVGYADHAVGQVIAALEEAGIYEQAMVVVVADHGVSIKPGVLHQRVITDDTVGDIAAIPLFIKTPESSGGMIDDRRALTIDILPTIADVIGAEIPWDMEGASLLEPSPNRTETTTRGPKGDVTFGVDGDEKLGVAERIEGLFPGGDPWALRPAGTPDLIGERVDISSMPIADVTGRLAQPLLYDKVDTSGDVIPVRFAGNLTGANGTEILAVAVNGEIGAITRAYRDEDRVSFLAMVPPRLLRDGDNRIDLIQVMPGGELHLVGPPQPD